MNLEKVRIKDEARRIVSASTKYYGISYRLKTEETSHECLLKGVQGTNTRLLDLKEKVKYLQKEMKDSKRSNRIIHKGVSQQYIANEIKKKSQVSISEATFECPKCCQQRLGKFQEIHDATCTGVSKDDSSIPVRKSILCFQNFSLSTKRARGKLLVEYKVRSGEELSEEFFGSIVPYPIQDLQMFYQNKKLIFRFQLPDIIGVRFGNLLNFLIELEIFLYIDKRRSKLIKSIGTKLFTLTPVRLSKIVVCEVQDFQLSKSRYGYKIAVSITALNLVAFSVPLTKEINLDPSNEYIIKVPRELQVGPISNVSISLSWKQPLNLPTLTSTLSGEILNKAFYSAPWKVCYSVHYTKRIIIETDTKERKELFKTFKHYCYKERFVIEKLLPDESVSHIFVRAVVLVVDDLNNVENPKVREIVSEKSNVISLVRTKKDMKRYYELKNEIRSVKRASLVSSHYNTVQYTPKVQQRIEIKPLLNFLQREFSKVKREVKVVNAFERRENPIKNFTYEIQTLNKHRKSYLAKVLTRNSNFEKCGFDVGVRRKHFDKKISSLEKELTDCQVFLDRTRVQLETESCKCFEFSHKVSRFVEEIGKISSEEPNTVVQCGLANYNQSESKWGYLFKVNDCKQYLETMVQNYNHILEQSGDKSLKLLERKSMLQKKLKCVEEKLRERRAKLFQFNLTFKKTSTKDKLEVINKRMLSTFFVLWQNKLESFQKNRFILRKFLFKIVLFKKYGAFRTWRDAVVYMNQVANLSLTNKFFHDQQLLVNSVKDTLVLGDFKVAKSLTKITGNPNTILEYFTKAGEDMYRLLLNNIL
eukprot:snap_masked-scaffold_12-processed-gene-12.35-mRNA-1 protein AED:1.00 eAED:1.00 QI:0/-1/0/0/-1/1/1/0/815